MQLFRNRVFMTFFTLILLMAGTYVAIRFAQGYRPTTSGSLQGTGLLSANSFPTGSTLYINGNIRSATDTTVNLDPGEYQIEIKKDGYTDWKKTFKIEKELVTQTNALLFPVTPTLTPLTFTGASSITPSPDGEKILFVTASSSASQKNGVYILDLTDNPLTFQRGARQIAPQSTTWDLTAASFLWSPASDQVLVSEGKKNVILDIGKVTTLDTAPDVGVSLKQTLAQWEEELYLRERQALMKFPPAMIQIATQSATNVYISPSRERMLYTATVSAHIADHLIAAVPAASTQTQERDLVPGGVYVYDLREDRNFRVATDQAVVPIAQPSPSPSPKTNRQTKTAAATPIPSPTPSVRPMISLLDDIANPNAKTLASSPSAFLKLQVTGDTKATIANFGRHYSPLSTHSPQWLPDSSHIILAEDTSIGIVDYDGTNLTQVYAGPFVSNFVYPWPNGSKLIILTNFNQAGNAPANLYAVGLR